MAKDNLPSWDETQEETTAELPSWEDTTEEQPEEEKSFLDTLGETAYDTAVGITDTGLGKMVGGATRSVYDLLSGEPQGSIMEEGGDQSTLDKLISGYYKGKEDLADLAEKSRERSPIATTVGSVGGEIAAMAPVASLARGAGLVGRATSSVGKLAELLGVGAVEGAISQMGQGDARLLEGDIEGTLEEAGEGALFGAGAAGLGAGIAKGASKVFGGAKGVAKGTKEIGEELAETVKGQDVFKGFKKVAGRAFEGKKTGVKGVFNETRAKAKSLANRLNTVLPEARNTVGKKLGGLREMVQDDVSVSLKDNLDLMDNALEQFSKKVTPAETSAFKDMNRIKNWIKETRRATENLDEIPLGRARKISEEARKIGDIFGEGENAVKDKELLSYLRGMSQGIDEAIDTNTLTALQQKYPNRVGEYSNLKNKYGTLLDLEKYAGIVKESGKAKLSDSSVQKSMEDFISKLSNESYNIKQVMSSSYVDDALKEAGLGEFAKELTETVGDINSGVELMQYINTRGAGAMGSLGRAAGTTGAYTAGKVGRGVNQATKPIQELAKGIKKGVEKGSSKIQSAYKNLNKTLVDGDPETIKLLGDKLEQAGKMRYSQMVKDLATSKDPTSRAIRAHAIMSQPAFRQDVRNILGLGPDERDKKKEK